MSWVKDGRENWFKAARIFPRNKKSNAYIDKQLLCLLIQDRVNGLARKGLTKQKAIQKIADDPNGICVIRNQRYCLSFKQIEKYYYRQINFDYQVYKTDHGYVLIVDPGKVCQRAGITGQ
jgi:hypothetical protein